MSNIGITQRARMNDFNTLPKIIEQLEKCGYECEGGYLVNNVAFLRLKEFAGLDFAVVPQAPAESPGEDTPVVVAPITKEAIIQILTNFQEQTMMKGKFAIPQKNFPHVADYILKEINRNMKGGTAAAQ